MTAPKGLSVAARLVLIGGWVVTCGGDPGTAPPTDAPADGRILVANETTATLEVAYLKEDESSGPRIVRTEVAPGTVVDVGGGQGLLPAGSQIELDLALGPAEDGGVRVRRKVTVTVDGQVLVTIRLLDPEDLFSIETEVTTSAAV